MQKKSGSVLLFLASCTGAGNVPMVGHAEDCLTILDALDSRAAECGHPIRASDMERLRAECEDKAVLAPFNVAECLAEIHAATCAKLLVDGVVQRPAACQWKVGAK